MAARGWNTALPIVSLALVLMAPAIGKERIIVSDDSLTLQECMAIALTHNRDVKRARAELGRVGGDRVIEKARFLPAQSKVRQRPQRRIWTKGMSE